MVMRFAIASSFDKQICSSFRRRPIRRPPAIEPFDHDDGRYPPAAGIDRIDPRAIKSSVRERKSLRKGDVLALW
jgi:hypothetical protein